MGKMAKHHRQRLPGQQTANQRSVPTSSHSNLVVGMYTTPFHRKQMLPPPPPGTSYGGGEPKMQYPICMRRWPTTHTSQWCPPWEQTVVWPSVKDSGKAYLVLKIYPSKSDMLDCKAYNSHTTQPMYFRGRTQQKQKKKLTGFKYCNFFFV